jgi:hypothetical protein
MENKFLSRNHPISLYYIPHHAYVYATRTNTPQEPKELIKQTTLPVPIFTINYAAKNIDDPVKTMFLKKKQYEMAKREQQLKSRNVKLPNGVISSEVMKYIELLESDPDPTIGIDYDWRFTGSNLEVINIGGDEKLVKPSMNDKYSLRLLDPAAPFDHVVMPYKPKYHERFYSYEIMKSEKYVGIRRQKSVNFSIIKNHENGDQYLQAPLKFGWSTEIAASTLYDDKLMFIDVNNKLVESSVCQLITDSVITLPNLVPSHQFPVTINAFDHNVVTYSNLKSLNRVDFREDKAEVIFNTDNFLFKCEEISCQKSSLHDNLLFLSTSHMLYGLDIRNMKQWMMHWTHQLVLQPTMLKTVKFGDDEVICLSSNKPGDMKILNCGKGTIENSWRVNWLSVKPRNIENSYKKMRDRGKLLLSDTVKQRIKYSTTGIAMIPGESKIELFTQNSIGDVFKSHLLCNDAKSVEEKGMKKIFQEWHEVIELERDPLRTVPLHENLKTREFLVTDIVNLKGVSKILRSEKFQKPEEDKNENEMLTEKAPRWKTNIDEDKEYRDVLAKQIFVEWDLDIEDFQPHPFAEALRERELRTDKGLDKVSRWLTTNSVDGASDMGDFLVEVPVMPLPLQEIKPMIENIFTQAQTQVQTQTTNNATQKSNVTKKPKRIKGF